MLEIGVHHAQNRGVGVLPAVEDGAGQASLSFAHQQAYARILYCDGGDHIACGIAAVVIDNQDFIGNVEWVEYRSNMNEQAADVLSFAESWNYQCKLFLRQKP